MEPLCSVETLAGEAFWEGQGSSTSSLALCVLPMGCLIQGQSRINEDFLINQQVPLGFTAMFTSYQICISNQ